MNKYILIGSENYDENQDYFDLLKENKQLKEEIENIKDFNNKLQASKDRLDKDDYNLAHILTELEEWLNKEMLGGRSKDHLWLQGCYDEDKLILDKIQKLKERYK